MRADRRHDARPLSALAALEALLAALNGIALRDYAVIGIEAPDLVNVDNIVEADDILLVDRI